MKVKKTVSVVTAFLLTVIALLSFAGCKQEDPKYDVAIKVANNYGMEWVFEPAELTNSIMSLCIREQI